MAGFSKAPPREKNALDHRKLNLSAPTPGHQGKFASLIWGFHANNPRITVYTNDPNDAGADKGYGKIAANMDTPTMFAFTNLLNQVIDHEGEVKYKIENKNFIFPGGKRSEKPVVVSETWIGKDAQGVIWLSVSARDRPKIKFEFQPSDFHHFMNGDGTPFSKAEASKLWARGYVRILENLLPVLAVANYVEPPPKDGGQGGGGYNRGGGGGNQGGGGGNYGGGNRGGNSGGNDSGFGGGGSSGGDEDMPF